MFNHSFCLTVQFRYINSKNLWPNIKWNGPKQNRMFTDATSPPNQCYRTWKTCEDAAIFKHFYSNKNVFHIVPFVLNEPWSQWFICYYDIPLRRLASVTSAVHRLIAGSEHQEKTETCQNREYCLMHKRHTIIVIIFLLIFSDSSRNSETMRVKWHIWWFILNIMHAIFKQHLHLVEIYKRRTPETFRSQIKSCRFL